MTKKERSVALISILGGWYLSHKLGPKMTPVLMFISGIQVLSLVLSEDDVIT